MRNPVRRRTALIVMLSMIFVFALVQAAQIIIQNNEAKDVYDELQDYVVIEETVPKPVLPETMPEETEALPESIISVDFGTLKAQYPDVVGWLYCKGTPINYPVAQGRDNNQYLRHLLNGKYNVAGTLFADYRNAAIGEDQNYVVYGHHMNNGSMFASLVQYKKQTYYDEHPIIYFLTPDRTYRIELLAGYVTTATSDAYRLNFETEEQLGSYIESAIKKSTFKSNVEYEIGDRLMTLSTCSYEFNNARYVVVGKMR